MIKFISAVRTFIADEEGVTAIEYGLIATLVALGIIFGAGMLGDNLDAQFQAIAGMLVTP